MQRCNKHCTNLVSCKTGSCVIPGLWFFFCVCEWASNLSQLQSEVLICSLLIPTEKAEIRRRIHLQFEPNQVVAVHSVIVNGSLVLPPHHEEIHSMSCRETGLNKRSLQQTFFHLFVLSVRAYSCISLNCTPKK